MLYALAPTFAAMGSKLLFVLGFGIILSMYGGGFATVPAYLADMFGTQFVGAIHGRLLTAWSTAGIIGPVVVNYIREFQLAAGVPRDQLYNTTMYILCAMLIAGLICNYLIKPVDPKWHMSEAEVAKLQAASASASCIGTIRIVRHRVRRARRQGRAVLGLRRHSAGMGRLDHAAERGQDPLIEHRMARGTEIFVPRRLSSFRSIQRLTQGNFPMLRTGTCLAAVLLVAGTLHTASAQTTAPAAAPAATTRLPPRQAFEDEADGGKAEGHEGQVERQQGQVQGLPQRGEASRAWPATTAGSTSKTAWARLEKLRFPDRR